MAAANQGRFRWGILGSARIAFRAVIPGIQKSEVGEVAAIASRSLEKAKAAAEEWNIPKFYGTYEELLRDPDIDAIYIPLPNHLHMEWTIKAAEAGKHVLCEKPLAIDAKQAEMMVKACEKAGVRLAEAFMYRHHPRYQSIKKIIASGEIGELRMIHASFTFNGAEHLAGDYRTKPEEGGGSLYDVGVYPLSAARMLLGQEPLAVTVHSVFPEQFGGVDMMSAGLVEFPDGVSLTFDCGMWADFRNRIEILGDKGRIEIPHAFLYGKGEADFTVFSGGSSWQEKVEELDQYTAQADDFAYSCMNHKPLKFPPSDSIRNMRLVEACLQSAKTRTRVEL